ncbi:hypothetical protein GUJ93_ZPchr0009g2256 [Zizania palustris]|uniref:Uncharacterized protein n=1 Tax=Zizania palustris TaxID=103762 RepID=A0A8J5V4Z6_ZIZPA|nr:hypothetical protein GUJ93_ZPchr0009g2256 [Zizania palustris]
MYHIHPQPNSAISNYVFDAGTASPMHVATDHCLSIDCYSLPSRTVADHRLSIDSHRLPSHRRLPSHVVRLLRATTSHRASSRYCVPPPPIVRHRASACQCLPSRVVVCRRASAPITHRLSTPPRMD